MRVDIKFTKSEEISLGHLLQIQQQSFDDVYLEKVGRSRVIKNFEGGSWAIASHKDKIVAYYSYLKPGDKEFKSYTEQFEYLLDCRKDLICHSLTSLIFCATEIDPPLTSLYTMSKHPLTRFFKQCTKESGCNVSPSNNNVYAFPGEATFDKSKDIISVELAVLPEYRRKGIATKFVKKLRRKTEGDLFACNRKDSAMYKLNKKLGCQPLFQFGPVYGYDSSLVLSVKKKPKPSVVSQILDKYLAP